MEARRSLGRRFGWLWAAYAISTFGTWIAFDAFPIIAILVLHAGPAEVSLLAAAGHRDTRKCLVLLGAILQAPQLMERLSEVLQPGAPSHRRASVAGAAATDARPGMDRMVASPAAFGPTRDFDTVPTSRYVFRTPFTTLLP